jgi:DNA-binding NtrC family response regulator
MPVSSKRRKMSSDLVSDSNKINLLLVDDEQAYVNILARRLERKGFQVKVANNGTQAIQLARIEDFDVAVLDLKMDDMDGIEVLKIFKKMVPDMAVIMLTGHGSEQAARDGIKFGAFDYLTKPCDFEDLLQKIWEAYEAKKTRS